VCVCVCVRLSVCLCVRVRVCVSVCVLQEREGKKVMEARSEDGQFPEASAPQPAETVSGGNPVSTLKRKRGHSPSRDDHALLTTATRALSGTLV